MRRQSVLLFILLVVLSPLISQSAQAQSVAPTPGGNGVGGSVRSILPSQGKLGTEDASLRTQTSRTYVDHGVYSRQISPGPVNYQDAQGSWQPIDNTLVPSDAAGYAYKNKANVYRADFPSDLSVKPIRIQLRMDWIQFAPAGTSAATSASSVSGNTITYTQPGYHLQYAAGNDVMKESIVLDGPSSPSSLTFNLTTSPGITAQSNASGGVDFVNTSGVVQFVFLPPTINDASGTATTLSHAVTMTLGQASGGGLQVTVAADPKWLADPGRTWPVTIDPAFSAQLTQQFRGATQDCTIAGGVYSTTSYCSSTSLQVGYDAAHSSINRSIVKFDTSSFLPTTQILSAELDLNVVSTAGMTTSSTNIDVYGLTHSWTNGATWSAYDGVNGWSTPGGDFSSTLAASATINQGATSWTNWYPTALAQGWVDGSVPNDGVIFKARDETTGNLVQFASSNAASSSTWPTLTITYIPRLGVDQVYPLAGAAGVGVNTANGNLVLHATDVAMQGIGLPLVVDRTYNSQCAARPNPDPYTANSLGADCWQMGTGQDVGLISFGDGSVAYTDGTGEQFLFHRTGLYSYSSPPGIDATLVEDGTVHYTLTFHASGEVDYFDGDGFLQSQTDRAGNTITYTYSGSPWPSQLSSITDTQGRTTSVSHNTAGYVSQITDPAGRTYKYGYDSSNRLTSYTDPAGKITQYAYNYSSTCACSIKITDPNGNVTTTQGDSSGRVTGITDALSHTTTFTYNSGNTVVTDPNGHATTYSFDNDARSTSVQDAEGHTTQSSWTSDNNLDTTTLPSGNTSKTSYDANNNPIQVDVHPSSGVTVSTKAAYGNSTFPYNPSSSTDEQGNTTTYSYNSQGLVSNVQDPSTHNTQIFRNTNGTVSTTIDANNHSTYYAYYSSSGAGAMTGMLAQVAAPAPLGTDEYYYNNDNTVQMITDGKGQNTFYTYDAMGRVTGISYNDSSSVGYAYDANGNLLSEADSTGTSTYTYNALNQLTQEQHPGGQTTSYTYDPAGNLLTKTDGGGQVTYTYTPADNLATVSDPQHAQSSFTYDVDGQQTKVSYPNGVSENTQFDQSGQLTRIWGTTSGGTTLTSSTYNYANPSTGLQTAQRYSVTDAAGNVTQYTYNALDQLTQGIQKNSGGTQIASYSYAYDPVGNMTSKTINGTATTMAYNAADELTSAGSAMYSYDANGNQTGVSGGNALTYNAKDQTASITPNGGSAISMGYRGPGQARRVTAGGTSYQYDATGLSQSSAGSPVYYTTTPDGAVLSERLSSGTYYYLHDGLGSVVGLTNSSGSVVNSYAYDPYGTTTSSSGTVANPFRYIGAVWDSSTGLYKMGERYYDPSVGRFTQQDPIGGGFGYADGNPINGIDPTGESTISNFLGKIGEGIVGAAHGIEHYKGPPIRLTGFKRGRIPDFILSSEALVIEVKNVEKLTASNLSQLGDELRIAKGLGFKLKVYVRETTHLTDAVKDFFETNKQDIQVDDSLLPSESGGGGIDLNRLR